MARHRFSALAGFFALSGLALLTVFGQQLPINFGSAPNDATGDSLRTFAQKSQTNFTTLFEAMTNQNAAFDPTYRLQWGTTAMGSSLLVTQAFATNFSAAPALTIGGATNALPSFALLTTSNVVIQTAITNTTVHWIAIGAK